MARWIGDGAMDGNGAMNWLWRDGLVMARWFGDDAMNGNGAMDGDGAMDW